MNRYQRLRCGVLAVGLAGLLLGRGTPARAGLTINATFDPSIASVSGAEAAINDAIAQVTSNITSPNNITVSIYFTNMTSGLGESFTSEYLPTYFQYYNAYAAVATQPNQLTALESLGTAPTSNSSPNPVNGNTGVVFTSAEGRNLGFATPGTILPNSNINNASGSGGTYDSEIGLNTSLTSPPNTLNSGTFGLRAVANHEIDEVLGIGGTGSTLNGSGSLTGPVGDLDLYRYSAANTRSYSNNSANQPYFSINGGVTPVSYFNQVVGADFADWQSNPDHAGFSPQVQDAFATAGTNPAMGTSEITALNVIGYRVQASPEPEALTMLGSIALGLSVYGLWYRKRRAAEPRSA
jgi:hypothetical protein